MSFADFHNGFPNQHHGNDNYPEERQAVQEMHDHNSKLADGYHVKQQSAKSTIPVVSDIDKLRRIAELASILCDQLWEEGFNKEEAPRLAARAMPEITKYVLSER